MKNVTSTLFNSAVKRLRMVPKKYVVGGGIAYFSYCIVRSEQIRAYNEMIDGKPWSITRRAVFPVIFACTPVVMPIFGLGFTFGFAVVTSTFLILAATREFIVGFFGGWSIFLPWQKVRIRFEKEGDTFHACFKPVEKRDYEWGGEGEQDDWGERT